VGALVGSGEECLFPGFLTAQDTTAYSPLLVEGDAADSGFGFLFDGRFALARAAPVGVDETAVTLNDPLEFLIIVHFKGVFIEEALGSSEQAFLDVVEEVVEALG